MALSVEIMDLDQKVSFEDGSVTNFLNIRLPDGSMIKALVTAVDAEKTVKAVQEHTKVFNGYQPPAVEQPAPVFAPRKEEDVYVFGDDMPSDNGRPSLDAEEEDEPIVPPQMGRPVVSRRVEAMEGGLPNVPTTQRDNRELDEDGIPSF